MAGMNVSSVNPVFATLQQAYSEGRLTPRQHISAMRERALAETEYNAWICVLSEAQLEPYLQALENGDPDQLPLYGLPFAIKDNIDLAGVPTTAACPDFSYVPETSATAVELLVQAGAIPLGKANLDQFATGLVGARSPYGDGKNVFNPDYISGGSSSGSAIATALGQVSFALGTDTAGSGRVPAVLNNLIGHKPTCGLVSTTGVVPACRSLDCVSVFALNAADAARVLAVIGKPDKADAWSRGNPHANTLRYFTTALPSGFSFGYAADPDFGGDDELAGLYEKAIETLSVLGGRAIAVDFTPFLQTAKLLYEGPWIAERQLAVRGVDPQSMLPVIRDIITAARPASAADAFMAIYRLKELKQQCDALMQDHAFMLMPTIPSLYTRSQVAADPIALNSRLGTWTNFINLLDYCATAVPVGATGKGPCWGVTLFARAFSDMKLLGFSLALQQALGLNPGAMSHALQVDRQGATPMPADEVDVVVCGAHLAGQPLNWQLTERGGVLKKRCLSAASYQLYALPDGKRPAMVKVGEDGAAIDVEVWTLPASEFGTFVAGIPAPLGIGKVELEDGSFVPGFVCEQGGIAGATDITAFGSWRAWLAR